jgi:N-methylhydantoinase A
VAEAQRAERLVYFDGGWVMTPIYRRDLLPLDAVIKGPAVIEQMDTTSLIEPGDVARSDAGGNLIVALG